MAARGGFYLARAAGSGVPKCAAPWRGARRAR